MPARPAKTTALTMQPGHAAPPSAVGTLGGTLFALALVLGLIFGLAWLARRMPGVAGMRGNGLRVVASTALSARERLVVVEVGGQQLLLGTGASGTRLLHTLETPLPVEAPAQPVPFAQLLAQHFGKKA
ncbi:flagellar biosynthetic protein FliO [Thermomonas brevis]|uniref:Flagellar protein n=1 Tax=Thermomonas brevis TaxID=215691 RepID=A0A7G9QXH3_9GAMM|nr:flagellar biosynthetic protein FliO [Thermomonas brevis]